MRIFCKQAVVFNHPKDYDIKFRAQSNNFITAPDWIKDSTMFKLLSNDNKLIVIESNKDIAAIEKANGKILSEEVENNIANEPDGSSDIDYSSMKSKELYELCVERGIEVEAKQPKEYYIEKLA